MTLARRDEPAEMTIALPEHEPSAQNITALAQHFIKSGYFQDATEVSKAVVKILAGREIGVGPFTAMTGINVIKGRITLSANLIASQIKRHGRYNFTVREHTDLVCTLEFFEDGEKVGESSFSMEDAKKAGLAGGDNWRSYPRNMLFARAISNGAKWYCPDVFGGTPVYTPDELDAPIDPQTGEIIQSAVKPTTPADNRYYCAEHKTEWFKSGKMRAYAHPIKDDAGRTAGWCNMKDAPLDTPEPAQVPLEKSTPSPSEPASVVSEAKASPKASREFDTVTAMWKALEEAGYTPDQAQGVNGSLGAHMQAGRTRGQYYDQTIAKLGKKG